ncbi:protein SPIRAL1-like 3 [Zingiber officinale]|uniref:protein SPIRAL1-like 3 n=1 Tax=Zingiber officinale TaxID=94328 RepID=UPI001C4C6991|nr:protein SPIRAL1-like 3 [Zingiber officinale]
MGRGVSCGGGQSSLGYLFGNGDAPKSAGEPAESVEKPAPKSAGEPAESVEKPAPKSAEPVQQSAPATQVDNKQIPAGIQGNLANNYQRSDGQNCGNFITDRPSTKVQAAPGGGSSLGFLFGDGGSK